MHARLLFFGALFCLHGFLLAQNENIELGVVQDSILVSGTTDETFALYLPESYEANGISPVIFIFEPGARGKKGIKPFIDASEKYGLILICSNNSRNGPYDRNFAIANRLFEHIFSYFNIKDDEMYLSGFSGGSRLASAIATLTNRFAGVIGCGAGFSHIRDYKPSTQEYAYVGLCGDRDMNYGEMMGDRTFLKLIKFNSTLITFNDKHTWPDKKEISKAVDWLYLQKKKKDGTIDMEELVDAYISDYSEIAAFIDKEEFIFAQESYERILKDYGEILELDSIVLQQRRFLNSTGYKKQAAALKSALEKGSALKVKFQSQLTTNFKSPQKANIKWWEKEMAKLEKMAEKGNLELKKMIYRTRFDVFVRVYARKNSLMHKSNEEQLQLANQLTEIIFPKEVP